MRQARALTALQVGFEARRFAVAVGGYTLAQSLAVLWQIQDVGIATCAGHWVGLRYRQRRRRGGGSGQGAPDKVAPPGFGLAEDGPDALWPQKPLWRADQAPCAHVVCVQSASSVVKLLPSINLKIQILICANIKNN